MPSSNVRQQMPKFYPIEVNTIESRVNNDELQKSIDKNRLNWTQRQFFLCNKFVWHCRLTIVLGDDTIGC